MDPTAVEVTDLAFTSHDRLLQHVRRLLRRRYSFPRGDKAFGVECVLSREEPVFPEVELPGCEMGNSEPDLRLDCRTGFGTASFVTGTFGFVAAARIIRRLVAATRTFADERTGGLTGNDVTSPEADNLSLAG